MVRRRQRVLLVDDSDSSNGNVSVGIKTLMDENDAEGPVGTSEDGDEDDEVSVPLVSIKCFL